VIQTCSFFFGEVQGVMRREGGPITGKKFPLSTASTLLHVAVPTDWKQKSLWSEVDKAAGLSRTCFGSEKVQGWEESAPW
jgi:hypothetical protein